MLARWGLRTAMDASWGLQLQLQAWPVPNRRIQPQFCSRLFAFSRCLCVVACLFIVDREWERALLGGREGGARELASEQP